MTRPVSFSSGERVLLIASTGIGNILQFTPALRALRHVFQDVSIDCLCLTNSAATMLRSNPHITETITHTGSTYICSGPAGKKQGPQKVLGDRAIIKRLSGAGYATSINIFPISGLRPAVFVRKIGAPRRIGTRLANARYRWMTRFFYTNIIDVTPDQHGIDIGFAHVGVDTAGQNRQMEFYIPEQSLLAANEYLSRLRWDPGDRIVGVHPGCLASHWQKRWPVSRFAAVAEWLVKANGCHVLIFIGPDERDLDKPLREHLAELGDSVCIDTESGLDDTAALMTACDAFLSNDSGLMHLASAVGTPVLGLFGPTDPRRYAPSGPRDRYLHHPLECSNCYDAKTMSSCQARTCLERITVEHVKSEIGDMLGLVR